MDRHHLGRNYARVLWLCKIGAELITKRTHARGRMSGRERVKGVRENDKGLRGTIPGRQRRNQTHTSFAMPIQSSHRHASALPYIWYQVNVV